MKGVINPPEVLVVTDRVKHSDNGDAGWESRNTSCDMCNNTMSSEEGGKFANEEELSRPSRAQQGHQALEGVARIDSRVPQVYRLAGVSRCLHLCVCSSSPRGRSSLSAV